MHLFKRSMVFALTVIGLATVLMAQPDRKHTYYEAWRNSGPLKDSTFFPVAVWYQAEQYMADYHTCAVNMNIVPKGISTSDLAVYRTNQIKIFTMYDAALRASADSNVIVGWMHNDEPDLAQSNGSGGYNACVDTAVIQQQYQTWRATDPTRPVYLNLSANVATAAGGRGDTCGSNYRHYPGYIRGCDISSYDIYPVAYSGATYGGQLYLIPKGIDSLRMWANYQKPAWVWVESGPINTASYSPTPEQVKVEIWMALIHEASGVGYFCHNFSANNAAYWLTGNPPMKTALTKINQEITQLAPALNSATVRGMVTIKAKWQAYARAMTKVQGGNTYIFAVHERNVAYRDTLTIQGLPASASAEVIGESRNLTVTNGVMVDSFPGYGVHLYKINAAMAVRHTPARLARELDESIALYGTPCRDQLVVVNRFVRSPVVLAVRDLRGRLVQTLPALGSGEAVRWDLRNLNGQRVPAGMYRLEAVSGPAALTRQFIVTY
jgi:hypothetical protein